MNKGECFPKVVTLSHMPEGECFPVYVLWSLTRSYEGGAQVSLSSNNCYKNAVAAGCWGCCDPITLADGVASSVEIKESARSSSSYTPLEKERKDNEVYAHILWASFTSALENEKREKAILSSTLAAIMQAKFQNQIIPPQAIVPQFQTDYRHIINSAKADHDIIHSYEGGSWVGGWG